MKYDDLKNEILELIERHTEGEYWDFKQQWHSNNADLIHDIICMANSLANRDCYIIIGVEDETYNVLGVSSEKRKNQQNVIDMLRQKPSWAGGYIPEVYVKTISIKNKEIDVVIIKQSNNTPFYLLKDYTNEGSSVFKGAIYTRKGDTNIPKTGTADLYDTELLWKRRFGLLYNPSQRAKIYLKDLDSWEMVEGMADKSGRVGNFLFYRPDPDYTVYFIYEDECDDVMSYADDVNDKAVGIQSYYLYAFYNVSYHTDYSGRRNVVLYYKDVPLFTNVIESVDDGRITVVPPEFSVADPCYVQNSFQHLMFEFIFYHLSFGNSDEAKEMFLRVIPVYENYEEYCEFKIYIQNRGFTMSEIFGSKLEGESLKRLKNTFIDKYDGYNIPGSIESAAQDLKKNKNLVINFASLNNVEYKQITEALRKGKMVVDWLKEWRNYRSDNW